MLLALFSVMFGAAVFAGPSPAAAAAPLYDTLVLGPDQVLRPGEAVTSANGWYKVVHQTDGNVVVYWDDYGWQPRWATHTHGRATTALITQSDGNLVLYNGSTPLWATYTAGQGPSKFILTAYGELTVNRIRDGREPWRNEFRTSP